MTNKTDHPAEFEAVMKHVTEAAEANGYILNPQRKSVEKLVGMLTDNLVAGGKRFCPCKQSHPLNPAVDVACPCPEWKKEIAEKGHCHCHLFYKKPG
jgi:ferredoxin-thioredoxin reductase catalytic chain